MIWKKMTIGQKISLGFGIILTILLLTLLLSVTGVAGIVEKSRAVINHNKTNAFITEMELEQNKFREKINRFLTDKHITEL